MAAVSASSKTPDAFQFLRHLLIATRRHHGQAIEQRIVEARLAHLKGAQATQRDIMQLAASVLSQDETKGTRKAKKRKTPARKRKAKKRK